MTGRSLYRVLPAAGLVVAGALSLPVLTVAGSLLVPADGPWVEFVRLVLPRYVVTTVWLVLGVGAGTLVIGVGTAWLVTMCRVPGQRIWQWALLLPMAVPAYLLAYTYADLLQYAGPVQTALRAWFGWSRGDYWFPQIRSLGGAIFVMTCVLYPYVYILARAAFLEQSGAVLEASRTLGHSPWSTFWRVALPLARPGIAAGVALAGMEVLADFGTVKHFELDTFATGIYVTWFTLGSPVGAARLAAGLMVFVLAVMSLERASRGSRRFHPAAAPRRVAAFPLRGWRAGAAVAACLLPLLCGFALPAGALALMAVTAGDPLFGPAFLRLAANTLLLALLAGTLAVAVAALIAYGLRLEPSPLMRAAARVAGLGYSVPGAVIAVGVMIPFGYADRVLGTWLYAAAGRPPGLVFSGTIFTLVYAYLVRFLAVSLNTVEAGLGRIRPSMDDAARTLGHGPGSTLLRVHAPLMRGSLLAAALLVVVDLLKELPATLILRPFNFDTLAVRVYQLASDERLAEASTAALAIVAVGILPVLLLDRTMARVRGARHDPLEAMRP
ncbi:MAG: iron ABC transporter permease [Armatimonadota bacterium]|nr:iron ABC transporter permease [Armatimonadota bacterium]MDR7532495.1 iron ABC transporter permease [Armatimonadota bacterium]MDR7535614.1 iron ABC transporter permease [Armatimonadota bacterium]